MRKNTSILASTILALGSSAAWAESSVSVQPPSTMLSSPSAQLAFPAVFGVPSAVAPKSKSAFVGMTYANPRGGVAGRGGDADIVAGYSIGNPLDAVSLTFGVALTGTIPIGDAGSFSVSASRLLQASGNTATYFGASASNLLPWGSNVARPTQYSAYVSHVVGVKTASVEVPLQFIIGYGTDSAYSSSGNGSLSDGAFAGIGIGVHESISISFSVTHTQVNVGMSYSLRNTGLGATVGLLDAMDNTDRQQLSISVSYGF